jgi:hypothetical protein
MLTSALTAPDDDGLPIEYDPDDDPYQQDLFAFEEQALDANGDLKFEW